MHRFYLSPEQCQGELLTLGGDEAHHALHVLRVQPRDKVVVLNGAGGEFLCRVVSGNRLQASLAVLESRSIPPLPYRITLAQALPKGKLFESIVQKATELGVFEIVPLLSERVVAHLDPKDCAQKLQKWRGTAVEAIKQCGSAWLPRVSSPMTPHLFLEGLRSLSHRHRDHEPKRDPSPLTRGEGDLSAVKEVSEALRATKFMERAFELAFVGSLQPGAQHPRNFFRTFQSEHGRIPRSACVWIGPEGDFTPGELALIERSGARPVTLGPLVLRTETAALYCLSILNYEFSAPSRD